ncbi:uncharacterized protein METZ01_LOCUS213705, partial [marine metagenome]
KDKMKNVTIIFVIFILSYDFGKTDIAKIFFFIFSFQ